MQVILRDITKRFGASIAVDRVSVEFRPGRVYGLLGENGAGKSTLMRVLSGQTKPHAGRIGIDGTEFRHLSPRQARRLGIGMLHQDPLDFPRMAVWESFSLGSPVRGKTEACRRFRSIAGDFRIDVSPLSRIGELALGQRQLVELLRLLDSGVRLLVLDEPSTSCTPEQKDRLFETLHRIAANGDRTVILITHSVSEAFEHCDRILVMREGHLEGEQSRPFSPDALLRLMFGGYPPPLDSSSRADVGHHDSLVELQHARILGETFSLDVSTLTVRSGEIIGLAGLEGNGQDLLLRGIAGLAPLRGGSLRIRGRVTGRTDSRNRLVRFVPATRLEEGLFPDLTMRQHQRLAFRTDSSVRSERLYAEHLDRFDLPAAPDRTARTLSGGNQQRLLLSLIPPESALLLIDHPTRGLDLAASRLIWDSLRERCKHGAGLAFSSSDPEEILRESHRLLVFSRRRIVADISASELTLERLGTLMVDA
jgi:general nucleoside transport system ATP-binding protein